MIGGVGVRGMRVVCRSLRELGFCQQAGQKCLRLPSWPLLVGADEGKLNWVSAGEAELGRDCQVRPWGHVHATARAWALGCSG